MGFEKIGLNLSVLENLQPPNISAFNVSLDPTEIANQIPQRANEVTNNFFGLGVMTTLFFYLIYKLGDRLEFEGQDYGTLRTVGISAGIVSIIGFQMLLIGYFTNFYHLVIFIGIFMISTIWVAIEDRKSI